MSWQACSFWAGQRLSFFLPLISSSDHNQRFVADGGGIGGAAITLSQRRRQIQDRQRQDDLFMSKCPNSRKPNERA